MITEIRIDADHTFEYTQYDQGLTVTPSSASALVFDNGGNQLASITGIIADDTMSFTFLAADNGLLAQNFKIVMNYTANSEGQEVVFLFDVVNYPMQNSIIDEDLFSYIKELRSVKRVSKKSSSAGTTTTLIDSTLTIDTRDWKGGRGQLLPTDADPFEFRCIQYAESTGTITFEPAFNTTTIAELSYILRESFTEQIERGFDYVLGNVRSKVGIASNYIDNNSFNLLTVYRTLYMICLNKIEIEGDKWDVRKIEYDKLFDREMSKFNQAYDENGDGNISDSENLNRPSFGNIKLTR